MWKIDISISLQKQCNLLADIFNVMITLYINKFWAFYLNAYIRDFKFIKLLNNSFSKLQTPREVLLQFLTDLRYILEIPFYYHDVERKAVCEAGLFLEGRFIGKKRETPCLFFIFTLLVRSAELNWFLQKIILQY